MSHTEEGSDKRPEANPVSPGSDREHANRHGAVAGKNSAAAAQIGQVEQRTHVEFWMPVLTGVLAATSIISAIIFGYQLSVMHGQLQQMQVQSQIEMAQTQPKLEYLKFGFQPYTQDGQPGYLVTPEWKNVGQTDAENAVYMWLMGGLKPGEDPEKYCKIHGLDYSSEDHVEMGAGETFALISEFVPTSDIAMAVSGATSMLFYGHFQYDDSLGTGSAHEHSVDWCYEVNPTDTNPSDFMYALVGPSSRTGN